MLLLGVKIVIGNLYVNRLFYAVHFWAPTFKWGISIANIADFSKPPEKLSYPQQIGMHVHKQLHLLLSIIDYSPFLPPSLPLSVSHARTRMCFCLYLILLWVPQKV